MENRVKQLEIENAQLTKRLTDLEMKVNQIAETTYKTSSREIINREVQFLQKVYDSTGAIVTEINP